MKEQEQGKGKADVWGTSKKRENDGVRSIAPPAVPA
jgi:hypothetical protein